MESDSSDNMIPKKAMRVPAQTDVEEIVSRPRPRSTRQAAKNLDSSDFSASEKPKRAAP